MTTMKEYWLTRTRRNTVDVIVSVPAKEADGKIANLVKVGYDVRGIRWEDDDNPGATSFIPNEFQPIEKDIIEKMKKRPSVKKLNIHGEFDEPPPLITKPTK